MLQIFFVQKSVKNKLVNHDLKHMNNWLSANKTSPNVKKTKLVFF